MFAVPGWSVSSDTLKAEKFNPNASKDGSKSKKRKRPNSVPEVNSANVTSLWETVVEGRPASDPDKVAKRSKKDKKAKKDRGVKADSTDGNQAKEDIKPLSDNTPKKDKKSKNKKSTLSEDSHNEDKITATFEPTMSSVEKILPAAPKLTPLQAAMRDKLISARFRHLNETLYTRPSEESFGLFQESPEMFSEYHEGFRQQVKVWPENPVDSFLADIQSRGKVRQPFRGKAGSKPLALVSTPLPRTAGNCTIADLGCGDAQLSQSLQANKAKLHLDIKSYDLQAPISLITKADIANLPLKDGDVNVAIFCLALMGTNWVDFIEEAYRILHWKGELWIAEIKSRFGPVRKKNAPVEHSVGNRKKATKLAKKSDASTAAAQDTDLAVEVDGADDRRRETDVAAFVETLRKRGFVLNGEKNESIDLSNKMFVKMRFIKSASPIKGKGVAEDKHSKGRKKDFAPRIDQKHNDDDDVNEGTILKPCVYKIR